MFTTHPTHRVKKEHLQAKDRHELKRTHFAGVVDGTGLAALSAAGLAVLAGSHFDVNFVKATGLIGDNLALAINKALERVTVIEDSFK